MPVAAVILGMVLGLWLPLLGVIVASRWRTSPSPRRRQLGRVVAFFSLWGMFNISVCATWGAFRLERQVGIGLIAIFCGAQFVVPWFCARAIATAHPGAGD